jgi:hypothetical protein
LPEMGQTYINFVLLKEESIFNLCYILFQYGSCILNLR